METRQSAHPSQRHLAALALGKLAPESRDTVQAHVSTCPACRRFLDETPRETLTALVRQAQVSQKPADPATRSAQVQRATNPSLAVKPAGLPAAQPLADDSIPSELRAQTKYRIIRCLGRGGMGSVYEAHHERMDRRQALKVINPELLGNPDALLRFEQEVKAVAKLDHPNIARAYDAENFGSLQVMVMEYVAGQPLSEFLKKRGRLTAQEACRCVRQACLGLQHAHERGLVHRDLKPQNLMLSQDKGVVKILDFGLAKVVSENKAAHGLTKTNVTMGTYEYTAPEQAWDAASADIRADIYSLGCTLYYLIAGQLPFNYPSDAQILMAHQSETPRPLCEVVPETPKELSDLVDRMLAKKPEDRPQTPREVAQALLPFAKGENASPLAPGAGQGVRAIDSPLPPGEGQGARAGLFDGIPARRRVRRRSGAFPALLAGLSKHLKRPVVLVGLAAAGVAAVILFAVVIRLRTPEGMLVVTVADPESTIEVMDGEGKLLVKRKAGGERVEIGVAPGKGKLRVIANGVELLTKEFSVVSGEREEINARLEPLNAGLIPISKDSPPLAEAPFDGTRAKELQAAWAKHLGIPVEITNSLGSVLVFCPPGKFKMGSPADEHGRSADEKQVPVTISKGFYLGKHSVTQAEYKAVMDEIPWAGWASVREGDDYPAKIVDWNDAAAFCRKLNERESKAGRLLVGYRYALPTEAQREYSCRAGTTTAYSFGDDPSDLGDYAWWYGNSNNEQYAHQVGQKRPNAWGLYDMHGNVYELCRDFYSDDLPGGTDPVVESGSIHVLRGGSVENGIEGCRSAFRSKYHASSRNYSIGFRVALVPATDDPEIREPNGKDGLGGDNHPQSNVRKSDASIPPPAVAPFDAAKAQEHQTAWAEYLHLPVEMTNSIGMKLILIPPGEFMMGSPTALIEEELRLHPGDPWYTNFLPAEVPQHRVRINKPYRLAATDVTQKDYERVMGSNPSKFQDPQRPVEHVSWDDAAEFCARLSELAGEKAAKRRYALPTEAQWEYACRAGTTTRWYSGDEVAGLDDVAWFGKNAGGMTHPVAQKDPNAWGLYDMHGNVWQWCQDSYDKEYYTNAPTDDPGGLSGGSDHVFRGGDERARAVHCRSAIRRVYIPPADRLIGFRVALVPSGDVASTAVGTNPVDTKKAVANPVPTPRPEPTPRTVPPPDIPEDAWTEWIDLFDGKTLNGWKQLTNGPFAGGAPTLNINNGHLRLANATGFVGIEATRTVPDTNYELQVEAMRLSGLDFASLEFPLGKECCHLTLQR